MTLKTQTKPTELKVLPIYITDIDEAQGVVDAIVNVFGIVDLGDDIIHSGAYTKTLNERGNKVRVKVLDSHNTDSVMRVIGKPLEIREIGRDELARVAPDVLLEHPEATGGLYTKTQYLLDTPEGLGVFKRIAARAVNEYSIALDPLEVDYSKVQVEGKERTVRHIRQLRLWEYSPVVFGMNPATITTDVKAASGRTDLPLADRARVWDGTAAEQSVRAWATDGDVTDWAKYGQAFFWHADNPTKLADFKMGFAEVIDGTLTAIPRGIFTVAAILQGSRGGVEGIDDAEIATIKGECAAYYRKMSSEFGEELTPPWDKAAPTPGAQKQATLGARLEASLRLSAAFCITDWLGCGMIEAETVSLLNSALEASMATLRQDLPASVADQPLMDYWSATGANEQKAGRMISGANREKIQAAIDVLQALMDASMPAGSDVPEQVDRAAHPADEKSPGEPRSPVTGSEKPEAAPSITDAAAIDRELAELSLMMEMTA